MQLPHQCQGAGSCLLKTPPRWEPGSALPYSSFCFQRQCSCQPIAQEERKQHPFSGRGPEHTALTMAGLLVTGCWTLIVSLNFVVCIFSFHRKEKGPFFPESSTFFSSTQSLSSLEVCSRYKNNLASSLSPSGAKVFFLRDNRLNTPWQLSLPFAEHLFCVPRY